VQPSFVISSDAPHSEWGMATSSAFVSDDGVTSAVVVAPLTDSGRVVMENPLFLHGTTTAFENRISWNVVDNLGTLVANGYEDVRSPDAGIPGPFDIKASYDQLPKIHEGVFHIFEGSAKDGTPIHVVNIPLFFPWTSATTSQ
jgi:hypothetical protein